jgi:CheY-like chemotaxis protein
VERAKLLLADDSVTIQRVIELTFADESVDVVAVGDGKAAIERLAADPPDIVLADVGMPERDGYEVAEHIKGTPQLSHIPVLLLTGAFEPIDEARAKRIGCDGVLVKPFEPQMVISRVRELLQAPRPRKGPAAAPVPAPTPVAAPQPARPSSVATADLDRLEPIAPDPARQAGDVLEDYFDRLDAALANLGAGQPPPPEPELVVVSHRADAESIVQPPPPEPRRSEPVSAWNPQLDAAAVPAKPPAPQPPAAVVRPADKPSAELDAQLPPGPIPPLHAAFAALLAAEQGEPVEAQLPPPQPSLTEDQIDQIATRVIARMGDDRMRALVLDVAERLVREEIDRIKRG